MEAGLLRVPHQGGRLHPVQCQLLVSLSSFFISFLSYFNEFFFLLFFFCSVIPFHVTCAIKEGLSMGIHERNGVVYNDVFCKR